MAFIQLGAPSNFGSETSPMIGLAFEYEKKRSGADMQYRFRVTVKTVSGNSWFGYTIVCTPTIAGSKKSAITLKANSPSQWTSNIVYTSSWYTVSNKTTGTTAISFAMSSNAGGRSQTFSYNMAIDPAASSFSVGNGTLGSALTISVTKNNSAFTSTITYKCGSASGTIADKSTATSISWTPPTSLANQNTTGTSLSCTLAFQTYSGTSLVGTSSKTITLTIPSSIVPTVSFTITDGTNNLTQFGAYVQGKSTMKIAISASGAGGSSISKYSTSANGSTYTSASFTTGVITSSGTLTISVTVTDSRGRTASASKTITVLSYVAPKISALSVIRCNASGTAASNGAYLKVIFSAQITSLNSKNTKSYQLLYKKKSVSSYTTVTLSNYANSYSVSNGTHVFAAETNSSYDIILKANDYFTSSSLSAVGPTITQIWSILKNGAGFAIGKIAELASTFDVGWNAKFRKDVEVLGTINGMVTTVKDRTSGNATYLNYGAAGLSTASWLAAWNGYELRAISPTNVRTVIGAAPSSHSHSQYYDSAISRTANTVLAAPNGSNGSASFRKLVAADLPDSGWVNCSLGSGFSRYATSQAALQVRKIGNIVHLRGAVKRSGAITPSNDSSVIMGTVPSGYRPSYESCHIVQGSGSNRFLLTIYSNGNICVSRYTNTTTTNGTIGDGAWLNTYVTWVIG